MKSIIKLALAATLIIFAQNAQAQDTAPETKEERETREGMEAQQEDRAEREEKKQRQIATLEARRGDIQEDWTRTLKFRIESINKDKDRFDLTSEEVDERKKKAAEEVALNIENQLAIIDNQIALIERTGYMDPSRGTTLEIGLGTEDMDGNRVLGVAYNSNKTRNRTYDRRTYGETVFAFGFNNAVSDNSEVGDDFSIGKSSFVEWGYAWKTRVFKNSGALQFKYGLSLQTNKIATKRNETLVIEDDVASYEEFPFDLKKSQIRTTNLVVPLHFEFGGWKKEKGEDYVRYRTAGKFRMGIGGYAGVRLGTQQKLKYKEDGNRIKSKSRQDYGGDTFVYGLSSYIRLTGDLSLYGKYDLSSAIETKELGEINFVSLGLRLDL